MTDPKETPPQQIDEDSPAVDGMLRELSHETDGNNDELVSRIMAAVEEVDQELHPPLTIIPMRYVWAAAAAVIAVGVGLMILLHTPAIAHLESGTVKVTRGSNGRRLTGGGKLVADDRITVVKDATIRLTDESTVTLAAGTVLTINTPDEGYRAQLSLDDGKILCRVSKKPGRFLVDAGLPIEVLGTTFGVSRSKSATRAAVYEGSVKVGEGAGILLMRGNVVEFSPNLPSPIGVDTDANDELEWSRADTSFPNNPLSEVTQWLTENSRFTFDVPDSLKSKRVTFYYTKGDNLVTAILSMAEAVNLECVFSENTCIIRKKQ